MEENNNVTFEELAPVETSVADIVEDKKHGFDAADGLAGAIVGLAFYGGYKAVTEIVIPLGKKAVEFGRDKLGNKANKKTKRTKKKAKVEKEIID